jgi:hypothetical protein
MDKQSPRTGGTHSTAAGSADTSSGEGDIDTSGMGDDSFDSSYMPGVDDGFRTESRADEVFSKMNWGSLGQSAGSIIPASYAQPGGGGGSGSGTTSGAVELACYANFPRPGLMKLQKCKA